MSDSTRTPNTDTSGHSVVPAAEAVRAPLRHPHTPSAAPTRAGPLSKPYRWLSIGMFSIIFLAAFEAMAVTTIMPLVARDLDGEALFALAFAVPLAAGIIGMVIAGNWTDRSGPLPSLITSAVLFVIGLVIAGTAVNMDVFIVGRFVHGLSGAAVIVPLYVIVGRVYPEHLRARVFAGFAAAWVIPSIIGPALAGVVAEALSWHWVFLGVIGLLLPAAAMMLPPILRVRDQVQGDPSVRVEPRAASGGRCSPPPRPWRVSLVEGARRPVAMGRRDRGHRGGRRRGAPAHAAGNPARRARHAGHGDAQAHRRGRVLRQRDLPARTSSSSATSSRRASPARCSRAPASRGRRRPGCRAGSPTASRTRRPCVIGAATLAVSLAVVLVVAAFTLAPAIAFVAWTLAGAAMGFMYPRFSVAVLALSPVSAQGFNSAALTISESLGAAIALAITALVSSAAGAGMFTADFAVTFAIAAWSPCVLRRPRRHGRRPAASAAR